MTRIITFTNQKGGVGKTTLTRELGIYLASTGRTVLIVDLDPQGNLSKSLLGDHDTGLLFNALVGGKIEFCEPSKHLSLLTSDLRLASLEKTLITEMDGYTRLKDLLHDTVFNQFEYILIDSPPSLGILSVNALACSTHFAVPMSPALYTMQGTNDLMATVDKVKKNFNPSLKLLGVIINEFDKVPVITREIKDEIASVFGSSLFSSVLSRSIKIEEAIALRKGLIQLPDCKVKEELIRLGLEFIDRVESHGDRGISL